MRIFDYGQRHAKSRSGRRDMFASASWNSGLIRSYDAVSPQTARHMSIIWDQFRNGPLARRSKISRENRNRIGGTL